jgi:hypothetical protein
MGLGTAVSDLDQVHLYTLCWNDKKMLPHFFEHYNPVVDRFFLFDNGSTDGSLEILKGDERVQVSHFQTEFDSFAETELRLSEEMWKSSRGSAEWVLVIDIDEHVYHADLLSYLRDCRARGVTAIRAVGYEMVADTFPGTGKRLCDVVTSGVRDPIGNDKLCLFDPCAIARSNFVHGRHDAAPEGRVVWPSLPEVLLLHYKKLGLDHVITRSGQLRNGLGWRDIERDWGHQYLWSPEEIAANFNKTKQLARPIPRTAKDIWQQEFTRLKADITTREAERQRLRASAAERDAAIAAVEARVAAADQGAARLRDELACREAQLAESEQTLSNTVMELDAVYRSWSWRATQPYRSLRRRLRRRRLVSPYPPARSPASPIASQYETQARVAVSAAGSAPSAPPPITGGQSPMSASAAPLGTLQRELELRMGSEPLNWTLRTEYFGVLERISRSHLGRFYAVLPEIATPLMLRAATSDVLNLRQIFLEGDRSAEPYIYGDYGFTVPPLERILDLGAYCGYTAVYFANRFPDAAITCVEPPGANFDVLLVNTAPYPNIRCFAAAVWPQRAALRSSGHLFGDWGNLFAPAGLAGGETICAYTISDFIAMRGWEGADFIKCLLVGAQVEVLTQPDRPWLDHALLVATKPPAGAWPNADDEPRLLEAFPEDLFERVRNQNMILAFRRRSTAVSPARRVRQAMPLVPGSAGLRPIELANINDRFGFYKFGGAGLNLVPNPPGTPQAAVTWHLDLAGHIEFSARILTGPADPASGVMIKLTVCDPQSGAAQVDERLTVPPATDRPWNRRFAPLSGKHDVTVSVEPAGPSASDQQIPWIRLVAAQFL